MTLHDSTFSYLNPTDEQKTIMADVRLRFGVLAKALETALPEGPDKTFIMRQLRTVAMWANVCITRNADGAPRT